MHPTIGLNGEIQLVKGGLGSGRYPAGSGQPKENKWYELLSRQREFEGFNTALKTPSGKIIRGSSTQIHNDLIRRETGNWTHIDPLGYTSGFVLRDGSFISKEEAGKILDAPGLESVMLATYLHGEVETFERLKEYDKEKFIQKGGPGSGRYPAGSSTQQSPGSVLALRDNADGKVWPGLPGESHYDILHQLQSPGFLPLRITRTGEEHLTYTSGMVSPDGVFIPIKPVYKGGPGSGRYPSGSGDNPKADTSGTPLESGISQEEFLSRVSADPDVQRAEKMNLEAGESRDSFGKIDEDGKFQYDPEREKLHQEISDSFLNPAALPAPGEAPEAFLVIGMPGAGKTTMLDEVGLPQTVMINPDEVLPKIPGHQNELGTAFHEEASDIVKNNLMPSAVGGGYNITIDSSGKNPAKMEKIASSLKSLGYKITLLHASVAPAIAAQRVYTRFKSGGRYMPPSLVFSDYKSGPKETYEKLKAGGIIDAWREYDRTEGVVLRESGSKAKKAAGEPGRWNGFFSGVFSQGQESVKKSRAFHLIQPRAHSEISKGGPGSGRYPAGSGREKDFADQKIKILEAISNPTLISSGIGNYLKQVSEIMPKQEGWKHNSVESYVLANGQDFPAPEDMSKLPQGVAQGKLGNCYQDAANVAGLLDPKGTGYTYVEGYVTIYGVPIAHAFNLDKSGKVVDTTLGGKNYRPGMEQKYFGVPIKHSDAQKVIVSRGKYGVLDNPEQNFPALRTGRIKKNDSSSYQNTITPNGELLFI